jgi:predicted nucleotidyltransferase
MSFDAVRAHLDGAGIQFALIGGVAVAARGASRSTLDIDVLTTDGAVLKEEFWQPVRDQGLRVDVRKGDWDDPLAGVVRIDAAESIDVVVGKYKWERAVIERAETMTVRGMELKVPRVADLILLKLAAGGLRDTMDAGNLLKVGDSKAIAGQLNEVIPTLPEALRVTAAAFLIQNSSSIG